MDKEKYEANKRILAGKVAMSLEQKVMSTSYRIEDWCLGTRGAYISLSGGLGSRVLLDIVRNHTISCFAKDIPAVFIDTGLEHKGVKTIATKYADCILKPNINFYEVLLKYGYPVISKVQAMAIRKLKTNNLSDRYRNKLLHGDTKGTAGKLSDQFHYLLDAPFKISEMCCDVMKKRPAHKFQRENEVYPITAEMVEESRNRKMIYLQNGCNMYNLKNPKSTPMAFWTQQDLLEYVVKEKIDIAAEYGEIKQDDFDRYYTTGEKRTGCAFCLFGCHRENQPNRIQRLYKIDKRRYEYCIGGGEFNGEGLWVPNKKGLGLGFVMDYMGIEYRPCGSIKTENNGQLKIV